MTPSVADIVDCALRVTWINRGPLLDGARERIISEAEALIGRTLGPVHKNQIIDAIELAFEREFELSSGHPFLETMFYDMGV